MKKFAQEIIGRALRHRWNVPETIPAHGMLKRFRVDSQTQIVSGFDIFNIEIETDAQIVGISPIAVEGHSLSAELVYPIVSRRQTISALMPIGTRRFQLRNLSSASSPKRCRIIRQTFTRFEDLRDLKSPRLLKVIEGASKSVFIHTLGKSGSASLQENLHPLGRVFCLRDHFVNLPKIPPQPGQSGAAVLASLTVQQLISSRIAMYLLKRACSAPGCLEVICGIRRFDTQLLASIFQNRGQIYMELGISTGEILNSIYRLGGDDPSTFWWETEFFSTHGFSLQDLERDIVREKCTWSYRAPSGVKFRFYRIEDGDAALRECLNPYAQFAEDPRAFLDNIVRSNIGSTMSYSALYQEVKERIDYPRLRTKRSPLLKGIENLFYGD